MPSNYQPELEKLGLSSTEAEIYLVLLRNGTPMNASAVAAAIGHSRSSVYSGLNALIDIGVVEAEAGYGSRFSAVRPQQALPLLVARKNDELLQCRQIAGELANELESLSVSANADVSDVDSKQVQVLRDPRVISERFYRLQAEAKRTVEFFVKGPIFNVRLGNPEEKKVQRRGVHIRALYERSIVNDERIKPYLNQWIAGGEEARVYEGNLPYKLVVFDRQTVLLTLVQHGGQASAMLVKHHPFASSLGILFDYFWQQSEPLSVQSAGEKGGEAAQAPDQSAKTNNRAPDVTSRNGRRGQSAKK